MIPSVLSVWTCTSSLYLFHLFVTSLVRSWMVSSNYPWNQKGFSECLTTCSNGDKSLTDKLTHLKSLLLTLDFVDTHTKESPHDSSITSKMLYSEDVRVIWSEENLDFEARIKKFLYILL